MPADPIPDPFVRIAAERGRSTRHGDTFVACDLIGWFDDLDAMNRADDRSRGLSGLALDSPDDRPAGFRGYTRDELTPVSA
jgi:hypothetical protein